ncbi:MAG TPA: hypothetical protein PKN33_18155 [Phycisphaerae bacterium]|nr:hypothetical protein [Phycisphaerae bacterium]
MNDQEPSNVPEETAEAVDESQPQPMKSKPILQSMSWMAGVAAGGLLAFLFVVQTTHTQGATKASRAAWRMRQLGPTRIAQENANAPASDSATPKLDRADKDNRTDAAPGAEDNHESRHDRP